MQLQPMLRKFTITFHSSSRFRARIKRNPMCQLLAFVKAQPMPSKLCNNLTQMPIKCIRTQQIVSYINAFIRINLVIPHNPQTNHRPLPRLGIRVRLPLSRRPNSIFSVFSKTFRLLRNRFTS